MHFLINSPLGVGGIQNYFMQVYVNHFMAASI